MKYKVVHTTKYEYSDLVSTCKNMLWLTPRNTEYQTVLRHRTDINPVPASMHRRQDYFGNTMHYVAIDHSHKQLQIKATSSVECRPSAEIDPTLPWESVAQPKADSNEAVPSGPLVSAGDGNQRWAREELENHQFRFPSPAVPLLPELAEYGRVSFELGRPMVEALTDLMQRIHTDFEYDPTATTVETSVAEAFSDRRGVCQDLAHVALAALRPLGIAARYVSGYLRTIPPPGEERLVGADASHAWVSVYCGAAGWLDLDPTNNLFPSTDHITLAWGRDFRDVCPVSGMYVGGGNHQLHVSVDVAPID